MKRIDVAIDSDYSDLDTETKDEAEAQDKLFLDWIARLKVNKMPSGIFELGRDDLRLFEFPENERIEIGEATKSNEDGFWEIEFEPLVQIARVDLVMLTTEIKRIQQNGSINSSSIDKPVATRERTSYLNIIGALLAQLTAGKANDTTVINQAISDFGSIQGISERKLQQVFASAKRSLRAN